MEGKHNNKITHKFRSLGLNEFHGRKKEEEEGFLENQHGIQRYRDRPIRWCSCVCVNPEIFIIRTSSTHTQKNPSMPAYSCFRLHKQHNRFCVLHNLNLFTIKLNWIMSFCIGLHKCVYVCVHLIVCVPWSIYTIVCNNTMSFFSCRIWFSFCVLFLFLILFVLCIQFCVCFVDYFIIRISWWSEYKRYSHVCQ